MSKNELGPDVFREDMLRYVEEIRTLQADMVDPSAWHYPLHLAQRRASTIARYLHSRKNANCSNCGSLLGGPAGHEISECIWVKDLKQSLAAFLQTEETQSHDGLQAQPGAGRQERRGAGPAPRPPQG